jgi:DNA-binding transcriptional MerR regulator
VKSYTIAELETGSGVDRRTIAYYIQQGLLPRVGRRGAKTRYPAAILDRLLFIQSVRQLQEAGQLRAVTLQEIRHVMTVLDAPQMKAVRDASPQAIQKLRALFADPDRDTSGLAVASEQVALQYDSMAGKAAMPTDRQFMEECVQQDDAESSNTDLLVTPAQTIQRLAALLTRIDQRAVAAIADSQKSVRCTVTEVSVTNSIKLAVTNIPEQDATLVEELAAVLSLIADGGLGDSRSH